MSKQPIENARDQDLRLSVNAMQRAARRALDLAAQTGTAIVVSRDGVIEQINPQREYKTATIQEPTPTYYKGSNE